MLGLFLAVPCVIYVLFHPMEYPWYTAPALIWGGSTVNAIFGLMAKPGESSLGDILTLLCGWFIASVLCMGHFM